MGWKHPEVMAAMAQRYPSSWVLRPGILIILQHIGIFTWENLQKSPRLGKRGKN
jgi:hypothetical protein